MDGNREDVELAIRGRASLTAVESAQGAATQHLPAAVSGLRRVKPQYLPFVIFFAICITIVPLTAYISREYTKGELRSAALLDPRPEQSGEESAVLRANAAKLLLRKKCEHVCPKPPSESELREKIQAAAKEQPKAACPKPPSESEISKRIEDAASAKAKTLCPKPAASQAAPARAFVEHTASAEQRRLWLEATRKHLQDDQRHCTQNKAYACPRNQEDIEKKLDELEKYYGKLHPAVRDLVLIDRPLTANEDRIFFRLAKPNVATGELPIGNGRLCIPYPRLNRLLARMVAQVPNIYSGATADDSTERALRAEAMVAAQLRAERAVDRVLQRLRRTKKRVMFAANLFNNGDILGQWTAHLEAVVAALGPDFAFVSLYESGSTDNTRELLSAFQKRLTELRVPHSIVMDKKATKIRWQNMFFPIGNPDDRIYRLAEVRNRAMAPLYGKETEGMEFDKVVFMNDISYRPWQIWELLNTYDGNFDLVCGVDRRIDSYDLWVMRDIEGHVFSSIPPYVRHAASADKARRLEPYPVYACWNGMAVMNPEPFRKHGIRFRRNREGECYQSECFLVFEDFMAKGYRRFFINPRVGVTYHEHFFKLNEWLIDRPIVQRAFEALYDPDQAYFVKEEKTRNSRYKKFDTFVDCVKFPSWGWPYCI